jgi:hypothetical protein
MPVKEMPELPVIEMPMFQRCPSCDSGSISLQVLDEGGMKEKCPDCFFVSEYVRFTCQPQGHCNPDIFAICPRANCPNPGQPSTVLCNRD